MTYRNSTGFSFITGGDRCLRFDYVISDYNVGGFYVTSLTVRVRSATVTTSQVFNTNTGNAWTMAELDLPAVDDMKVRDLFRKPGTKIKLKSETNLKSRI